MPRRTCPSPSHRGGPGLPLRLHNETDALSVLQRIRSRPERMETIVLLLDDHHEGGTSLVIDGDDTADNLDALIELIEQIALTGNVGGVVLACVRPADASGDGEHGGPADQRRFIQWRRRLDDVAVDLLDWWIATDDEWHSVRERAGYPSRWLDG